MGIFLRVYLTVSGYSLRSSPMLVESSMVSKAPSTLFRPGSGFLYRRRVVSAGDFFPSGHQFPPL